MSRNEVLLAQEIAELKQELADRKSYIDGQMKAIDARDKCIAAKNAELKMHDQMVIPDGAMAVECCLTCREALAAKWQDFLPKQPEDVK